MNHSLLVLNYHDFYAHSTRANGDRYAISESTFIRQLDLIANLRLPIVSVKKWQQQVDCEGLSIALTFDDGYVSHYQYVMPLLKDRGIKASFFPQVSRLDTDNYLSRAQLQTISKLGHTIGSHGMTHQPLLHLSSSEWEYEVHAPKRLLSIHLNQEVDQIALPFGVYSSQTLETLLTSQHRTIYTTRAIINADPTSSLIHRFNMGTKFSDQQFERLLLNKSNTLFKLRFSSQLAFLRNRCKGATSHISNLF
jgi:peptidoglycan/xylan/chitin deacetylase (PgdA/CDA1 family)